AEAVAQTRRSGTPCLTIATRVLRAECQVLEYLTYEELTRMQPARARADTLPAPCSCGSGSNNTFRTRRRCRFRSPGRSPGRRAASCRGPARGFLPARLGSGRL